MTELTHPGGKHADRHAVPHGLASPGPPSWMLPMVRRCLFPTFVITSAGALPACAHPGHLDTLAGHDHWVAGAAIGLAIALGIYGALKGKKDAQADPDEVEEDTPEESPA